MKNMDENSENFYKITPDRILESVEEWGLRCTGRTLALNSLENRVFEVEVETEEEADAGFDPRFRVLKFYRPGRWTKEQILEEHQFLADLNAADIPVISPIKDAKGNTLRKTEDGAIYYTLFPRCRGRSPDELNEDQLEQVGRLLARIHMVGATKQALHRIELSTQSYGRDNLETLLSSGLLPEDYRPRYTQLIEEICNFSEPRLKEFPKQRIHGDAHLGNLIWNTNGFSWVDFDDMLGGPLVQDLWLVVPGRDAEALKSRDKLLAGYEQMRTFDRSSLSLVEMLRALRIHHFNAWIAKRWDDPIFPKMFDRFDSLEYWREQLTILEEQLQLIYGYEL